ncbi:hypothetical protein FIBSPDRAFT_275313 [Athelia psychrophila]|uniref:Uncharacterized protein n=1 Tax=Athelia psychrophila TaxID=1759441 RepID=A0A166RC26_9AGAM|nr:hypothetical protein FIBSPDRAFT_275313 [Fibularhizoctonia sp. CBS 109695]
MYFTRTPKQCETAVRSQSHLANGDTLSYRNVISQALPYSNHTLRPELLHAFGAPPTAPRAIDRLQPMPMTTSYPSVCTATQTPTFSGVTARSLFFRNFGRCAHVGRLPFAFRQVFCLALGELYIVPSWGGGSLPGSTLQSKFISRPWTMSSASDTRATACRFVACDGS